MNDERDAQEMMRLRAVLFDACMLVGNPTTTLDDVRAYFFARD
jgi:hypothetical protein